MRILPAALEGASLVERRLKLLTAVMALHAKTASALVQRAELSSNIITIRETTYQTLYELLLP